MIPVSCASCIFLVSIDEELLIFVKTDARDWKISWNCCRIAGWDRISKAVSAIRRDIQELLKRSCRAWEFTKYHVAVTIRGNLDGVGGSCRMSGNYE